MIVPVTWQGVTVVHVVLLLDASHTTVMLLVDPVLHLAVHVSTVPVVVQLQLPDGAAGRFVVEQAALDNKQCIQQNKCRRSKTLFSSHWLPVMLSTALQAFLKQ